MSGWGVKPFRVVSAMFLSHTFAKQKKGKQPLLTAVELEFS